MREFGLNAFLAHPNFPNAQPLCLLLNLKKSHWGRRKFTMHRAPLKVSMQFSYYPPAFSCIKFRPEAVSLMRGCSLESHYWNHLLTETVLFAFVKMLNRGICRRNGTI